MAREEANVERLLRYCSEQSNHPDFAKRLDLQDRLKAFLDNVDSRIALLKGAQGPDAATPQRVASFNDEVQGLRKKLREVKEAAKVKEAATATGGSDDGMVAPSGSPEGLRQRRGKKQATMAALQEKDVAEHQENLQAQLAVDMTSMARQMKQQSLRMHELVTNDNKALDETNEIAEENLARLDKASHQLQDQIARTGGWGTWKLLFLVLIVFIFMVFFIWITK
eukprot:m.21722 g.21722  ORF g.21722 m.21722 type:complete len:224 (+) comp8133_c0_seq1:18-689(+)